MQVSRRNIEILDAGLCDGANFVLQGQLDRSEYTAVNKVLIAAGGKWNRSAKAHVFDCMADDAVSDIVLTGKVVDAKREFDFFETPPSVLYEVMQRAEITTNQTVLEPSAGGGRLSFAAHLEGANVTCVEVQKVLADALSNVGYEKIICGDFLDVDLNGQAFDRIVMNPPFGKQADIKHVTHAFSMLAGGGRLVAIMGGGVAFRENKLTTDFRELVAANDGKIEPLPDGSFKISGTSVSTVIVTITKPIT